MSPDEASSWAQIEAAANKEGSVTVYALNTIPPDQMGRFEEVWSKDYPKIKVEMTTGLQPSDIVAKVTAEQDAKAYTADVAQLGGTTSRQLDRLGVLAPIVPPAVKDPSVKWRVDPILDEAKKGALLGGTLNYVPIWINTKLVKPEDEPKTHNDLTDPKWKGKISWQVPWAAGYGWNEYYLSKKYYGQEWVTKMQAQDISFGSNSNDALNQIARGEYAIGLANNGNDLATRLIKSGQPLKAVWPDDFVYGSANGFSALNGAPHPNAAKVFVNWWFTKAGQQLYEDLGQFPNRADMPGKEDWMKGFDHPKEFWWPKASDDALAAPTQKEAAAAFKK
ncbi:MAG TPA: extracellular solute-binding protein [Chloroflexota bacterium]|nr:extracellular solute-binding protein [Chloroflexota bacterium]